MSAREELISFCLVGLPNEACFVKADTLADAFRAEVLREAADAIEADQHRRDDEENAKHGFLDHETELQHVAVHQAGKLLRSMANTAEQGGESGDS